MSLAANVVASVRAKRSSTRGLTRALEDHPIEFSVDVGDCTKVWSDRRTFTSGRDFFVVDDINFETLGISVVKLLFIKNLSSTSQMGLSAGWTGSAFSLFPQDTTAWNFAPMINLGSLTLRGYPIREGGSFFMAAPNSAGFSTTAGGSVLRLGGTAGQQYEIYVLGT